MNIKKKQLAGCNSLDSLVKEVNFKGTINYK